MDKLLKGWVILFLVTLTTPVFALEGIGYVTDHLQLTLFSEKGTGSKVKTLESADVLDILEESRNFLKVRTTTGEVGWVKRHYIVSEPPGQLKVLELERIIRAKESKIVTLEKVLDNKKVGESLREDYEKQLVVANQENVQLFNDKQQLTKKIDQASLKVKRLESDLNKKQRFHPLAIAAVIALVGMLFGIIMGWALHVRKLRKRFYGFKI
ncbi:MAG TPA: TIGR04211 family SH3 domain-containing protein [Gammaproteobacteria bacterium]|jgi:SH3 domain protein|nr:TIGR04211 family SH3 domain-containing protein [Gammaproteobacteria bacterium]